MRCVSLERYQPKSFLLSKTWTAINTTIVSHSCFAFSLHKQRLQLVERIATSIDDYQHLSRTQKVAAAGCPRVSISMAELRSFGGDGQDGDHLSQRLRLDPFRHLRALEIACHNVAERERPGYDKDGTSRQLCCITILFLVPPMQSPHSFILLM